VWVSYDVLGQLRDIITDLLKDKDVEKAKEILPTQNGVFFGSLEYDKYYWSDLEHTLIILDKVDTLPREKLDLYYICSW